MSKTGADLPATDAALVQKITQRDEAALAALYDRYGLMLSSVLNRILRDTQAAEEILQDIFFQLWRNPLRFDPWLAAWLAAGDRAQPRDFAPAPPQSGRWRRARGGRRRAAREFRERG